MPDRELEHPSLNLLEKSTLVPFILQAANELTGACIFEYILDELFWMTLSRWNYWVKGLKAFDPVKMSGECEIFPFTQGDEVVCHCFMEAVRSHSTLLTVEDDALLWPRAVAFWGRLPELIPSVPCEQTGLCYRRDSEFRDPQSVKRKRKHTYPRSHRKILHLSRLCAWKDSWE